MFSKRIVESARFLKMPPSTQALYFHLGLHADDDGITEGYNVMMQTGATEDDLKILTAKGFVTVLNADLVTYINDWQENNKIRSDRKVDSIYKKLLVKVLPDIEIQQAKARADTGKKTGAKAIEENGRPMDNQWTSNGPHRLGKDRLGKDSNNINSSPTKQDEPHIPYKDIINYLNQKTGGKFRYTTKSYQTLIKARWKEGYRLKDFKQVIDNKAFSWQNTGFWKYMRPSTLFRASKFDDYLNENNLKQHQNQPTTGGYTANVSIADIPDDELPF